MQELRGRHSTYQLDAVVARGRSGEVYRAFDAQNQAVAVKVYDRSAEFEREINTLRLTTGDHVIRFLESGETPDGRTWMATPWIEGRTLAHVLSTEGPLSPERSHRLLAQLAEAVDAVHDAGFVHGDVSPRNVMIDLHDRVTLIDLATSTRVGETRDGNDSTAPIEVDGTPRYASPEVAAGGVATSASDRYAVGLIAYELLTAAFPFPEVATPIAMLAHHAGTTPIPPSEHRPSLSSSVDDILVRSLEKAPEARPGRAAEIAIGIGPVGTSAPAGNQGVRRGLLTIGAFALIVAGVFAARAWINDDSDVVDGVALPESIRELDSPGPAGRARGIACNLLDLPGFERQEVPEHFYAGDATNTVSLAANGGLDGSGALQLGADGRFGLYGEVVPIAHLTGGATESLFVLSVWARPEGEPTQAGIFIDYLNADFQQLTFERGALGLETVGDESGSRVTVLSEAPANAAFAVPTVFKDGSTGSLMVDEAVFAPVAQCVGVNE